MAGLAPSDVLRVQSEKVFVENITFAAERLADVTNNNISSVTIINERNFRKESLVFWNQSMVTPMPGYFLFSFEQGTYRILIF